LNGEPPRPIKEKLDPIGAKSETFELSSDHGVARCVSLSEELSLALTAKRLDGAGMDLVHRAVNEALADGARPAALACQYLGGRLSHEVVEALARGVRDACNRLGITLSSFTTAKSSGAAYLIAAIVAARSTIKIDPGPMSAGDVLFGLEGRGLHSCGFAFSRAILFGRMGLHLEDEIPGTSLTVGGALLEVRRCYAPSMVKPLERGLVRALIAISGGGLRASLQAALPSSLDARVDHGSWPVPRLFTVLVEASGRPFDDLLDDLNMGLGAIAVVPEALAEEFSANLRDQGESVHRIGRLVPGEGRALFASR
jgi:phosphoribosylformylglycinamidine cyclo-ligase